MYETPDTLFTAQFMESNNRLNGKVELPLLTCMYLGGRWKCLFVRGDVSLRAQAAQRLAPGSYWLRMPADKLWVVYPAARNFFCG